MSLMDDFADFDPKRRFYKKLRQRAKTLGLVLMIAVSMIGMLGFPYVQGDYTFRGPRSTNGFVPADQKLSAWYFGVTGWREVAANDRRDHRLPVVLFIPFSEVLRLTPFFPFICLRE